MADHTIQTSASPTTPFLFVGNDRCLDFLNTLIADQGQLVDLIQDVEDLLRWLVEAGMLPLDTAVDLARRWRASPEAAEVVLEVRALRARLTAMVDGLIAGIRPAEETIDVLNAILQRRTRYERIVSGGNVTHDWSIETRHAFDEPGDLLAPLAHAAAVLLSERDVGRIRKCENPACVLHFYDTSKNGSRRWCDTRTCGNRIRVAQHYHRQHAR